MSGEWVRTWLRMSAAVVADQAEWLTGLDAAIGDGDHGINLDRGFRRVLATVDDPSAASLGAADLLTAAGRTIMGSVGGASGALYGRALLRAGAAISPRAETGISGPAGPEVVAVGPPGLLPVTAALDAAVDAIATLGRAQRGDKTMLDALVPSVEVLHESAAHGVTLAQALAAAAAAAADGLEATRPLVARRGRASYLGERSAGHLDPGAASAALLIRALADTVPVE